MPEPILDVRDLTVRFRTRRGIVTAVDGLSFTVAQGEVLGIVGESGSGKSVSMMTLMRLIRDPNASVTGQAYFRGRDLEVRDLLALPEREMRGLRGREIAMIFQDPMTALTPVYTVGWQIAEQIRAHERVTKKAALDRAVRLLDEVGIPDPARRVHQLPARVLRRHAAAGDDRHGPVLQSCAADRRRAHDSARRHHAGADPRPDAAAAGGPRLV